MTPKIQNMNEAMGRIMELDLPHCAVLDPEKILNEANVTDAGEREFFTNLINQANATIN